MFNLNKLEMKQLISQNGIQGSVCISADQMPITMRSNMLMLQYNTKLDLIYNLKPTVKIGINPNLEQMKCTREFESINA